MAPGCGPEDYEIGHKYKIPPFNNLEEEGRFPDTMGVFKGYIAKENDDKFMDYFKEKGFLIESTEVEHEYAHCWRCHEPVIFRTTRQWFFKIEDLKDQMRELNKNIKWQPDWAGNRQFDSWLDNLRDNSITRQRYWGCPVPIWKCSKCDNCVTTNKISDSTIEYISDAIKNTLFESRQEISEKALIQILKGEKLNGRLEKFDYFSACRNFSSTEIKIVIQLLVSRREINKSVGSKNYISINQDLRKEVDATISGQKKTIEENYDTDLYLFNSLREVRKKAADRFLQSAFLICPDNILRDIVRKKPITRHDILSINQNTNSKKEGNTKMRKNELYQDYHDFFEYFGNTEIERIRMIANKTVRRDWIIFDSAEEAMKYFNNRCGEYVGYYN